MNALRHGRGAEATERYATSSRPAAHLPGDVIFLDRARRNRSAGRSAPSAVRVIVADGQALVRAGFRALLESEQRIVVVAEAASGDEAVTLAARIRPDVVLVDANLPGLDCVEVTRRLLAESGGAVMVLAGSERDERISAALRAGASGVLLKDTDPTELVRAVELVARGEAQLSSRVTRRLIAELAARSEPRLPDADLLDELTPREREVVAQVARGLSNDEIAERLVITRATAKTHVSRAMLKLHARDRAQLVVFAYEAGFAPPRATAPLSGSQSLSVV